ncbi:unnamed protein product [Natator depressus]
MTRQAVRKAEADELHNSKERKPGAQLRAAALPRQGQRPSPAGGGWKRVAGTNSRWLSPPNPAAAPERPAGNSCLCYNCLWLQSRPLIVCIVACIKAEARGPSRERSGPHCARRCPDPKIRAPLCQVLPRPRDQGPVVPSTAQTPRSGPHCARRCPDPEIRAPLCQALPRP